MGKKLTQDDWIQSALSKWNHLYDYSQAVYINSKEKVTVICNKHGPWQVMPVNHVSGGKGCPKCGIEKNRLNLIKPVEKFIEQARSVHGSKYSYDTNDYSGAKHPIAITCPQHGVFFQSPEVHLRPSDCPDCAMQLRLKRERDGSASNVAKRIHDASNGVVSIVEDSFSNFNSKAEFVCKVHGTYKRLVNTAIHSKHPCVKCSTNANSHTDDANGAIALKILHKFGDKYSYEIIVGKNLRSTSITLSCTDHGNFTIAYSSLRRSPGCPICSRQASQSARTAGLIKKNEETQKLRSDLWISRAIKAHGGRFNYGEVNYVDAKTPVTIICPTHGKFQQIPDTHLKSGCRACADEELLGKYSEKYFIDNPEKTSKVATLYYIELSYGDEVFYKVGITTTTVANRFSMTKAGGVKVKVLGTAELTLLDAFRAEQVIQKTHGNQFRYRPLIGGKSPRNLRIGPSECFSNQLTAEMLGKYFKQ
jgi:ribosomal protein S27E